MGRHSNFLKITLALTALASVFLLAKLSTQSHSNSPISISNEVKRCKVIVDCELKAGDILLKRKLTNRTRFVPIVFSTYFTHSALYLGDSQIAEAQGFESTNADEIRVVNITDTDWAAADNEQWLIIRPKNTSLIPTVSKRAAEIAGDDTYVFGYGNSLQSRQQNCSGFVAGLYSETGLLPEFSGEIITPDELATALLASPNFFLWAAASEVSYAK